MNVNTPEHYNRYRGPEFATELRAAVEHLGRGQQGNGAPPWDEIVSAVIALERRIGEIEHTLFWLPEKR